MRKEFILLILKFILIKSIINLRIKEFQCLGIKFDFNIYLL